MNRPAQWRAIDAAADRVSDTGQPADSESLVAAAPAAGSGQGPGFHPFRWLLTLALLLPTAMLLSLSYGRFPLTPGEVASTLFGLTDPAAEPARVALLHSLVYDIRLPRVLAAVLIGAALAASGTAYQAVFVNPLVSPGILGVLAGASFGAALGLLAAQGWWLVQLLTIGGGLAAMLIGVGIGRLFGAPSLVMLVLGGIFSGALFTALLSLAKYLADPYEQLPTIVYWLMGSLGQVDGATLWRLAPPMLGGILGLAVLGRALDALAMGDDAARLRNVRRGWGP